MWNHYLLEIFAREQSQAILREVQAERLLRQAVEQRPSLWKQLVQIAIAALHLLGKWLTTEREPSLSGSHFVWREQAES